MSCAFNLESAITCLEDKTEVISFGSFGKTDCFLDSFWIKCWISREFSDNDEMVWCSVKSPCGYV